MPLSKLIWPCRETPPRGWRAAWSLLRAAGVSLLWLATGATVHATDGYLDPSEAFRGQAAVANGTIQIAIDIAPGYHLYRDRLEVAAEPGRDTLGPIALPAGRWVYDETFQKSVEIYESRVAFAVPLASAAGNLGLAVSYQGCADRGLCYPPQTAQVDVVATGGGVTSAVWRSEVDNTPASTGAAVLPRRDSLGGGGRTGAPEATDARAEPSAKVGAANQGLGSQGVDAALRSGNKLLVAGVFLAAGLLLAFTPCVLPMVPILSSIIVGQGGPSSRARGFSLSLSYSLGMAVVYTAFGVAAGLAGQGLAAALQNPWVLGCFALLLATLSLSMFGVFELQVPGFIQSRLSQGSNRLPAGRLLGVFAMGGMSALIVGPCVAAPLAGALVFISQTRDVLVGGMALFCLAAGMSVPLLLVGLSAGSVLPRMGGWMESVKAFFGVILLAVALWIVAPVLPGWAVMALIGAGLLVLSVHLRLLEPLPPTAPRSRRFVKGAALVLAVAGVAQLLGAMAGGNDPLRPLAGLVRPPQDTSSQVARDALGFRPVHSLDELDAVVRTSDRPVMLDFYADWCVSCKEMEHLTFSHPEVRSRLRNALLLQADVTANSAADKALLKRFDLFGPPGIVFLRRDGHEAPAARVVGFVDAASFGESLAHAGL